MMNLFAAKTPALVRSELTRLTAGRLPRIALVALVLVPVLYGGLYLWANKDPYAGLGNVPAALVDDDLGATVDGEKVDYGSDVANQVTDDDSFDWHEVSAAAAASGVANGTYDFSLTLPAGFSEALTSADGDDPRQGTVVLTTNDTNSFLATTIATQAADRIRSDIAERVGEEAANRFLVGIETIRGNLSTAADGATTLADGTATAAEGATALADGSAQVAVGADSLSSGLATLQSSTAALPAQTAQLSAGAQQVAAGNAQLATAGGQLAAASQSLAGDIAPIRADIAADLAAAGLDQAQIDAVLARLDPLGTDVTTANSAVQQLNGQLAALSAGASAVSVGAGQLANAAPALSSGIGSAASGASSLAAGAESAASGAASLAGGVASLNTGAGQLRDGLDQGLAEIPVTDAASRATEASTIGDPVAVRSDALTSAGNYGAGLAPFFISLAAWIGIYALFLIVKPLSKRALTAIRAPIRVTVAGWLTPALLGAVQMAGLFFTVAVLLGFRIDQPALTLGFMVLASATFAAIILALNVWFGSVGQFFGLILMVVQLVTAGGTFPWQTLPGPLAVLHHVLPMSSSVDGLRQLMYGGSLATAGSDALILLCWLAVGLLIATAGAARMTRYRTLRDLRPSLIG